MSRKHGLGKLASCAGLVMLGWLAAQWLPLTLAQTTKGKAPGTSNQSPSSALPDYDRNVVAYVNGQPITRLELAEDLIARKGKQHMEMLINRRIIDQACAKAGIVVTDEEVEKELQGEMSARKLVEPGMFERFLKQQGLSLYEYKEDSIRKWLMMQKLAKARVMVTEEEIKKAFDVNYGERIRCRVILVLERKNKPEAEKIYFRVKDDEEEFRKAAKQQQIPHLAANAGETVISHANTLKHVADEAFKLADGEVSHILEVPEGWLILRREELLPADQAAKLEDVRPKLEKMLFDKKMEQMIKNLFLELRKQAAVRDYLNSDYGLNEVMTESFKESERKLQGGNKPAPRGPAAAGNAPRTRGDGP